MSKFMGSLKAAEARTGKYKAPLGFVTTNIIPPLNLQLITHIDMHRLHL
jgi:hypothetical protein